MRKDKKLVRHKRIWRKIRIIDFERAMLKNEIDNFRLTFYCRSIYNTMVLYKER